MSNDQWNNGQNNQWAPQQQPSASEWGQQGQASASEWQSAQQQGSANEWGQQGAEQSAQQGAEWGQQQASASEWQQGQSASEWGQQADQGQQQGWGQQADQAQQGWDQQQAAQQQGWGQQADQAQQGWDQNQQQGWDQQQAGQQGWDQSQQQNWNQQQGQQWQGGAAYPAHAQSGGQSASVLNFDFSRFSLPKSATIIYIVGIAAIAGAWLFRFIGMFTGDVETPFGTIDTDPSTLVVVQTLIVGLLEAAFHILLLRLALEGVIALIKIAEKKQDA